MVNPVPLVSPIVSNPLTQEALVPITAHIGYTVSYTKHRRNMRKKIDVMNVARAAVEDHMNLNKRDGLEIPSSVNGWLQDVGRINEEVEDMPTDVGCCLINIKSRHKIGRRAFKISEEIDNIMKRKHETEWTDSLILPGTNISSMNASTNSAPSSDHHVHEFPSRKNIFSEALQALESDHEYHMVALCGMGGVGKTTMMQKLKKVVLEKPLFKFWVEVVIGLNPDTVVIQNVVAYYLGIKLNVDAQQARTDMLRKRFEALSEGGTNSFLIILDDVWERIDLNDIGLSTFPNHKVKFKVLLTSQDRNICNLMRFKPTLTLTIEVLTLREAQRLFCGVVGKSDDVELIKIGKDIVEKCYGLPGVIQKMADDLVNKSKDTWKDTFYRLEHHDIINTIAPTSFKNSLSKLEAQTRSIFFLCGLFSKVIPIEELVRYGWGLEVFKGLPSIEKARNRLNSLIEQLMHKHFLMESEDVSCTKMHDLMLSFVLNMLSNSKGEPASFVRYSSMPEWSEDDMSIYERIISTCEGITCFPRDLTFPKLSILKLLQGDESLIFPPYFYKEMKELKVIAYDNMKCYPAIRGCSIKLRVLHLHQCSLQIYDCSSIGNLYNLEVLSFVKSTIQWLPSIIGKLKKLRLLDLSDCSVTRIDEGVFKDLKNLEELYAISTGVGKDQNAIRFTNDNLNEMAERSKKLSALEFEFLDGNAQLENISFANLKRFKISVGCSLARGFSTSRHTYENTLQLVTNSSDIFKYKMNELFKETEVLCLCVADMNDLGNIEVNSERPLQHSSFHNLRVLVVSECTKLKNVFTLHVIKGLSKLEYLEVDNCNNMQELIDPNGSRTTITFPKLKFLSLRQLPKLLALCCGVNIIELPQLLELQLSTLQSITNIYPANNSDASCLLKTQIGVPKLEKLQIEHLENLKEIWPREFMTSDKVAIRMIQVGYCSNLVNLFPCNPVPLLCHLEELRVENCGSLEVRGLGRLTEVCSIKGEITSAQAIRGFEALKTITISECTRFGNVFTPTTINSDIGVLERIANRSASGSHFEVGESSQTKEWPYSSGMGSDELSCVISSDVVKIEELKTENHDSITPGSQVSFMERKERKRRNGRNGVKGKEQLFLCSEV